MIRVAIALGSNLGDRHAHLAWAVDHLGRHLHNIIASHPVETEAVDVPDPQPPYLNAVVVGETSLPAGGLMEALMALERDRGRKRPSYRAPRTLDLDLILYGREIVDAPGVVVPHPRFRERRFVLEPLAALVPDWKDPVTDKTVRELLGELEAKEKGA